MSPNTIGIVAARAAALALSLAGQVKAAAALNALADAAEAGRNVDEHMATVAAKLKAGDLTEADWDDVTARIGADSARLQD